MEILIVIDMVYITRLNAGIFVHVLCDLCITLLTLTHAQTHTLPHNPHKDSSENQLLLKESDFIAFFDQFPFSDLFQHILQVSGQGESCDCHIIVM